MFSLYYILCFPLTLIILFCLLIYRVLIRHALGRNCNFLPTCSKYAWDSVLQFGAIWGGILAVNRLFKCRPNHPAGVDMPKLNLYRNYKWKC